MISGSAFCPQRASLGCELVAMRSQLTFYRESIRQKRQLGVQPSYVFGDHDGIYGEEVSRFLVGTEVEEIPTAYRSPWQNPFAERSIRTLRRELLDQVIVLNAKHLKGLLKEYVEEHYHQARPHQGLDGDTPFPSAKLEPEAGASRLVSIPLVGGLHHRSVRVAARSLAGPSPQTKAKRTASEGGLLTMVGELAQA
jgi:Integrase core domain